MKNKLEKLPRIGMRIIKSAAAVFLCFLFYHFFRKDGIVFYSQLAALWCMQPLRENSMSKAWQRIVGTALGAALGLVVLLIDKNILVPCSVGHLGYSLLVSAGIILVLYITLLLNQKNASYFSCVVFLSVVVVHLGDNNPYLFVAARVMDTMIGLAIGMLVNEIRMPCRRRKDILFISGMDDTLLASNQQLSDYSRVELNRMLAEGARFTVSTIRTPASLMEPLRGIDLKLPVIAMDGAVMYDLRTHEYIHAYVLSRNTAEEIRKFLDGFSVNYFMNMLMDNILVIQYKELLNSAEKDIYDRLRISPYRNYTNKELFPDADCVYFMLIEKKEKTREICENLRTQEFFSMLRVSTYDSADYPGYAYIKIYNKNATREHMIHYLQQETGLTKTVTFGSIEGKYDIVIDGYNNNQVVKTLKKMYCPPIWSK